MISTLYTSFIINPRRECMVILHHLFSIRSLRLCDHSPETFQIHPTIPTQTHSADSNLSPGLSTATHVFVQHDTVHKPCQPPYDGLYSVVKRTDKHFTIYVNGRNENISIDRLKPTHLDQQQELSTELSPTNNLSHSQSPPTPPPPPSSSAPTTTRTTHSGHHVHFPRYLSQSVSGATRGGVVQ